MNFDESHWLAYRAVNLTFAQVVLSQVRKGDMVWVQDYHLMLLPLLLRGLIAGESGGEDGAGSATTRELGRVVEGIPEDADEDQGEKPTTEGGERERGEKLMPNDIKIGFFLVRSLLAVLHSHRRPDLFLPLCCSTLLSPRLKSTGELPSSSPSALSSRLLQSNLSCPPLLVRRILPVRREILLGILHCDLIGFHTYDYARHFLSSCTRILGLPTMPNGVELDGRYAHVGTFPIGIEPGQFVEVRPRACLASPFLPLARPLSRSRAPGADPPFTPVLRRAYKGRACRSASKSSSSASTASSSSLAWTGSTTSKECLKSYTRSRSS